MTGREFSPLCQFHLADERGAPVMEVLIETILVKVLRHHDDDNVNINALKYVFSKPGLLT